MKRVLVVCEMKTEREGIINIVKSAGYDISKVRNNRKAVVFFQNGGIVDLIIIGHKTHASEVLIQWVANNRQWIPIIFISSCECESKNVIHTNKDDTVIEKSVLIEELPVIINGILGHPDPLNKSI